MLKSTRLYFFVPEGGEDKEETIGRMELSGGEMKEKWIRGGEG